MRKPRENNRISPVYREPTDQELRHMSFRDMTPDERERFARLYPKEDKRRWRIILADLERSQKQLSEQWIRMPESSRLRIIKQEPMIRFEAEQKSIFEIGRIFYAGKGYEPSTIWLGNLRRKKESESASFVCHFHQ